MKLSPHFSSEEFECKCGCGLGSDPDEISLNLIDLLERIRAVYGRPIHISSGLRCPAHNAAVGGKVLSAHLRGMAADVAINSGRERYDFLKAAFAVGCKRIGDGPQGAIHVDVDTHLPQMVSWIY